MNIDDKVADRFRRAASGVPMPAFTMQAIVLRGMRRRLLQRVAVGLSASAAAIAVVVAFAWLPSEQPPVLDGESSYRFVTGEISAEPAFDPHVLGSEVRLVPIEPPTEAEIALMAQGVDLSEDEAIISIGRLDGTPWRIYRAFGHIAPGENRGGDFYQNTGDFWCEWAIDDTGSTSGPSCAQAHRDGHSGTFSVFLEEGITIVSGIPETVSVVSITGQAGSSWQRPVGGVAAFPIEPADSGRYFLDRYGVPIESDAGPPETWRDPMPGDADIAGSDSLATPDLIDLASLRYGGLLYSLEVPGGAVLVRVRFDEPPLLFGTSCHLVQSVPLPYRWQGACLEKTVNGSRVVGPWLYGTELAGGGWTDDGWSDDPGEGPTTTTTVVIEAGPPSQTAVEAERDGVIPALASIPYESRVHELAEVSSNGNVWILAEPTDVLVRFTSADGCRLGDPNGTYPTEVICVAEYGEILLLDEEGDIAKAYPMPGAVPSWIHVTPEFVYAGRIGDGALPSSTLVRIDLTTLESTVVVIPHSSGGQEWPPDWHIATEEQTAAYSDLVGFAPATGTQVTSWIGQVFVNLEGIDALIAEVTG